MKLADEVFSNLSGLRRREWERIKVIGGGIDRRYRLRSWFLSLSAFANDSDAETIAAFSVVRDAASVRSSSVTGEAARRCCMKCWRWIRVSPRRRSSMCSLQRAERCSGGSSPCRFACFCHDGGRLTASRGVRTALPKMISPWRRSAYRLTSPGASRRTPRPSSDISISSELTVPELDEWRTALTGLIVNVDRSSRKAVAPQVAASHRATFSLGDALSPVEVRLRPSTSLRVVSLHRFALLEKARGRSAFRNSPTKRREPACCVARRRCSPPIAREEANSRREDSSRSPTTTSSPIRVAMAERIIAAWGMTPDPTMGERWREFQKTAAPVRPTPRTELSEKDKADVQSAFRFLFEEFGYEP